MKQSSTMVDTAVVSTGLRIAAVWFIVGSEVGCRASRARFESDPLLASSCEACHRAHELSWLHRLGYVHLEACGQRPEAIFRARVGSQRCSGNARAGLRVTLAYGTDQSVPVLARHADVGNQDVEALHIQESERIRCAACLAHRSAGLPQHL